MTISEACVCPKCGTQGNVHSIQQLMNDIRYDNLVCPTCNASWRAYYRVTDVSAEIMYLPSDETVDETSETPSVEEV